MTDLAPRLGSRAVVRPTDPGATADCAWCGESVKFRARVKSHRVIANRYENDKWVRVEHYHHGPDRFCYLEAGEPYGTAIAKTSSSTTRGFDYGKRKSA